MLTITEKLETLLLLTTENPYKNSKVWIFINSNKKEMGICVCTDSRKDTAALRASGVEFQSRAATIARATLFAMWLLLLLSSIE